MLYWQFERAQLITEFKRKGATHALYSRKPSAYGLYTMAVRCTMAVRSTMAVLCTMSYLLCTMYCVLCTMYYVLCTMY